MRVKAGFTRRRRHKKVLKRASGYYSMNSRSYSVAVEKNDRVQDFLESNVEMETAGLGAGTVEY